MTKTSFVPAASQSSAFASTSARVSPGEMTSATEIRRARPVPLGPADCLGPLGGYERRVGRADGVWIASQQKASLGGKRDAGLGPTRMSEQQPRHGHGGSAVLSPNQDQSCEALLGRARGAYRRRADPKGL